MLQQGCCTTWQSTCYLLPALIPMLLQAPGTHWHNHIFKHVHLMPSAVAQTAISAFSALWKQSIGTTAASTSSSSCISSKLHASRTAVSAEGSTARTPPSSGKALMIVESPTKAAKIQKFLGSNYKVCLVSATAGFLHLHRHILWKSKRQLLSLMMSLSTPMIQLNFGMGIPATSSS